MEVEGIIMSKWITIEDASRVLGVSDRTVQYWISNDTLATRMENGKQYVLADNSELDSCNTSKINHRALMMDLFLFRIRKHLLNDLRHHTIS